MGWIILIMLAVVSGAGLWRWGDLPRSAREPIAAALLLGMAGYAWQGRPGLPAHPVRQSTDAVPVDEALIEQRTAMGQRFGSSAAWLGAADGAMRAGLSRSAVTFIKSGLRENPKSADLWIGLGNALVAHGGGLISPAAEFAYRRAETLSPDHPGAPFFLGLAYAQSGRFDQARVAWERLMAKTPPDAPWRKGLEAGLARLPQ